MRAHHANLPFPRFTKHMTKEVAKHVVMFRNAFPPKSGLSKTYSPRTIMKVKAIDRNKVFKLHFGAYVQVNEDRNVTNTLEERKQGAICLGTTGNLQGTYISFLLCSGKKITRGKFTGLPKPKIFIKRVAAMTLAKNRTKD